MSPIENWLRWNLKLKEIGWKDLGEEFTRFQLIKSRWFNVYLHRLWAAQTPPDCHDHPWGFIAILLKKGYKEYYKGKWHRRYPGQILFRPATASHNVITPYGVSWSLIITTKKSRDWGFHKCED